MKETEFCLPGRSSGWFSARQFRLSLRALLFSACLFVSATASSDAVEVIYQSEVALADFNANAYSLVYNENLSMSTQSYGYSNNTTLSSTYGPEAEFQSLIYTGIPNPQSMTVNPEGTTAWVLSSYKSGSDNARHGNIYRVDLTKYWGVDAPAEENSDAVTEGPEIVTGHGQTISYNPKTNELWYVRETKVQNTTLVQVDPDTLEVVKEIHFRFSTNYDYPPTFVFDRDGNCWTYTRSVGSSWVPRGAIRFYKGSIEDDHVSFEMIMQGLRYPPGWLCQAFGYNAYNDRLYVVSDGEYISVPASKAGFWSPEDVETTVFGAERREFEGIAFSEEGVAYLLLNKPSEIMRDRVSYENGLKERERIDRVKAAYEKDSKAMKEQTGAARKQIARDQIGEILQEGW